MTCTGLGHLGLITEKADEKTHTYSGKCALLALLCNFLPWIARTNRLLHACFEEIKHFKIELIGLRSYQKKSLVCWVSGDITGLQFYTLVAPEIQKRTRLKTAPRKIYHLLVPFFHTKGAFTQKYFRRAKNSYVEKGQRKNCKTVINTGVTESITRLGERKRPDNIYFQTLFNFNPWASRGMNGTASNLTTKEEEYVTPGIVFSWLWISSDVK